MQREWTSFQASVLFPDYAAENLLSLSANNDSQALNILMHLTIWYLSPQIPELH
jgi:hypothetical protein